MKFTHIIFCVAAIALIGGCASHSASVDAGPFDHSSFKPEQIVKGSLVRLGNEVSLAIQNGQIRANYAVACDKPEAWLLYSDVNSRRYPGGRDRYSPRQPLSEDFAQRLKSILAATGICQAIPDWREVHREKDVVTSIDRNSIQPVGAEIELWAMFDFSSIALDIPYQAPYGQKVERFRLSCAQQWYEQVAGFDVDGQGRVTDGIIFGRFAERKNFADTDSGNDYLAAFKAACASSEALSRLPVFVPRKKEVNNPSAMRDPDPLALQIIAQLGMPPAKKHLTRLVTAGTSTFQGKTEQLKEEFDISPYPANGVFYVKSRSFYPTKPGYSREGINFLGFFNLSSQTRFSEESKENDLLKNLEFSGNLAQMELNSDISYAYIVNTVSTETPESSSKYAERCKVIDQISASVLHSDLTGSAKRIECRRDNDQYKRVYTYYFLEDYAYALMLDTSKNSFYYSSKKIVEVGQQ